MCRCTASPCRVKPLHRDVFVFLLCYVAFPGAPRACPCVCLRLLSGWTLSTRTASGTSRGTSTCSLVRYRSLPLAGSFAVARCFLLAPAVLRVCVFASYTACALLLLLLFVPLPVADPGAMIEKLAARGRKMVTIIDPHIKRDPNYFIHKTATDAGYYIKNKHGSDFDGWCWPGSSSYLDFTSCVAVGGKVSAPGRGCTTHTHTPTHAHTHTLTHSHTHTCTRSHASYSLSHGSRP